MPELMTPDAGVAADAAPVVRLEDTVTPSAEEVAAIVGDIPVNCEVSDAHPCTKRNPQLADYIIVWESCNCSPRDENFEGTTAICKADMKFFADILRSTPVSQCPRCGFVFQPAKSIIRQVVAL